MARMEKGDRVILTEEIYPAKKGDEGVITDGTPVFGGDYFVIVNGKEIRAFEKQLARI